MVWQDSEVGEFANAKYVNVRITVSDEDYSEWTKKFNTPGTPTVVFLDSEGKEIDRFVGFGGDDAGKDEVFQMLKDYSEGVNTLPAVLAEYEGNPEDVGINYTLAKKYLRRFETDKAVPLFEKILELDPDNTAGYREEASYRVALQMARMQRDPSALEAFIASGPENQEYLRSAYTTAASTYARNEDLDKARETYEKAMEVFPNNASLTLSYANAIFNYKIEELYERGLELNEKAKALDPDYELSTIINLVTYYSNTDQKDKVVELLDETIKSDENMKNYYVATILNLEISEKYDFAIDMMKEEAAKEEHARAAILWRNLGRLYEKKGDLENALIHMRKAAELSGATRDTNEVERFEKEIQKK